MLQTRLKFGLTAALLLSALSIIPQLSFCRWRGAAWHGAYLHVLWDEAAYSAYVNALIDGRPRKNDPFSGRDDRPDAPQPESLFSIQFVPAYLVAWPARVLGLSASTAFIVLTPMAAFASALALFWLLVLVTRDAPLATTGVIVVLCLGALAGSVGVGRGVFDQSVLIHFPPFLRRYQPAAAFPLFFAWCATVWLTLTTDKRRRAVLLALVSGALFALLVFSYFYLWTTAAAWLTCLALLLVCARPHDWRRGGLMIALISAQALAALIPYVILLAQRATTMDSMQALTSSRQLDLFRSPEILGAAACGFLALGIWRGGVDGCSHATLFAAAFGLTPFVVFNQQLLTGRSLQPFHYQVFIANYLALVAVLLTCALLWHGRSQPPRQVPRRILVYVSLLALGWGVIEVSASTLANYKFNVRRDEMYPVINRLAQMAAEDVPRRASSTSAAPRPVVFSYDLFLANNLPTVAPQALLWSIYMTSTSGLAGSDVKHRFYQNLYYSGVDAAKLAMVLAKDEMSLERQMIFGAGDVIPGLSVHPKHVTATEVQGQAQLYATYVAAFSREQAAHPLLSYAIVPADNSMDFSNLDRWYERDGGERVGNYILYRVRLK